MSTCLSGKHEAAAASAPVPRLLRLQRRARRPGCSACCGTGYGAGAQASAPVTGDRERGWCSRTRLAVAPTAGSAQKVSSGQGKAEGLQSCGHRAVAARGQAQGLHRRMHERLIGRFHAGVPRGRAPVSPRTPFSRARGAQTMSKNTRSRSSSVVEKPQPARDRRAAFAPVSRSTPACPRWRRSCRWCSDRTAQSPRGGARCAHADARRADP